MEKICGEIKLVGNLTGGEMHTPVDQYGRQQFVGSFRTAVELDALQIGDVSLTKVRCQGGLYNELEKGREACVYIFRTLLKKSLLLGIKYSDSGEKHVIDQSYHRGTILQFVTVLALLNSIGGLIVGGILGGIVGLGQSAVPPMLGFLCGAGVSWWTAYQFHQDYKQAKAD